MTNIFGPGHHPNTNETAIRPTPVATNHETDRWFAQCNENDPNSGTNIDALFLNALIAELRQAVRTAGAQESELSEVMLAEAMARYASGAIYCVDTGVADAYILSGTGNFVMPKSLFTGMRLLWRPATTNTGPATVNFNGLGVKALLNVDGALAKGDVRAGALVETVYDAAANNGAGAHILLPSSRYAAPRGMQIITASGVWTVPDGVRRIRVRGWGAGGGGGGGGSATAHAGGGGGGGYAETYLDVTPGEQFEVEVGVGGAAGTAAGTDGGDGTPTSFGDVFYCQGGKGGKGSVNGLGVGGDGGSATGGILNIPGRSGGNGIDAGIAKICGFGGATFYGYPAGPVSIGPGHLGSFPGGGGSGASAAAAPGGHGANGLIIVEW